MMTKETARHEERAPLSSGLSVKEISNGISTLVKEGSRDHIIGEMQDLNSKYKQKREQEMLSDLIKEVREKSFDHDRKVELHPIQSGLVEVDEKTARLETDSAYFTIVVRVPVHTEALHSTAAVHVDRVYLVGLDEDVRKGIYEHASERLGVDMQSPSSDVEYALEQKHDPQFLRTVNDEIAAYLLDAWHRGHISPHAAFTQVSRVKNTLPSQ